MHTRSDAGAEVRPLAARLRAPGLTALVLGGATLGLALRDPHVRGSWGFCPFLLLTGQPCPLCGGLRAVNDLTRGDVTGALASNALAVAVLPVLAGMLLVWGVRRWRGTGPQTPPWSGPRAGWAWLGVLGAWWGVRLLVGDALGP
ncbi:MAG: DUF2752 domain-containing protein [Kineosporiaceae bacterium]